MRPRERGVSASMRYLIAVSGLTIVGLSACAGAQTSVVGYRVPDTSAFAALLRAIQNDTAGGRVSMRPLRVDPRPLRNDRQVWEVSTSTLASVSREELDERKQAIVSLGMVEDDADFQDNCGGTMSPATPGQNPHRDCPLNARIVISVGLPRRGDTVTGLATSADSNRWTVRVLVSTISSAGYNVRASDFLLERLGSQWQYLGKKVVGWVE
jgi:hypothetical protein